MSSIVQEPQLVPAECRPFQEQFVPVARLIWRSRRSLLRLVTGGLVVTAVVAFLIPSEYESRAQMMPPDPQQSSISAVMMTALAGSPAAAAPGLASSLLANKTGAIIVTVLESRTVQDDLINRFDLRKVYRCRRYDDARKILAKRTAVEEDRKSGVIKIVVTDYDRHRARELAQGYVDELDNLLAKLSTSSARRERIFIEERLKTVKQDLDDSFLQLSQFSSNNATFNMQDQTKVMLEAAAKLQGELIAAESEVSALEPIYGNENMRLRSARMRVAQLRHQLKNMGGTSSNAAGATGDLYPSLRKMPLLGVTYYDLYRRMKIQETIYEILTKQFEVAKVQEAKEIPTVKMLDLPDVPENKSFPPRLLIILFGAWLTLMGGIAWLVVREAWRRTGDTEPAKAFLREVLASRFKRSGNDSFL